MKCETKGWVVINIGHPITGSKYIVDSTFRRTRKESISELCKDTNKSWEFWKRQFHFRAVKATHTVQVNLEDGQF